MDPLSVLGLVPESIKAIRAAVRGRLTVTPAMAEFRPVRGSQSFVQVHLRSNVDFPLYEVAVLAWRVQDDISEVQPSISVVEVSEPLRGPVARLVSDGLPDITLNCNFVAVHGDHEGVPVTLFLIQHLPARGTQTLTIAASESVTAAALEVVSTSKKPSGPLYRIVEDEGGRRIRVESPPLPISLTITGLDVFG